MYNHDDEDVAASHHIGQLAFSCTFDIFDRDHSQICTLLLKWSLHLYIYIHRKQMLNVCFGICFFFWWPIKIK